MAQDRCTGSSMAMTAITERSSLKLSKPLTEVKVSPRGREFHHCFSLFSRGSQPSLLGPAIELKRHIPLHMPRFFPAPSPAAHRHHFPWSSRGQSYPNLQFLLSKPKDILLPQPQEVARARSNSLDQHHYIPLLILDMGHLGRKEQRSNAHINNYLRP